MSYCVILSYVVDVTLYVFIELSYANLMAILVIYLSALSMRESWNKKN